ncbi:hypothetical protein PHSC3_001633 [Chlamydiales bacterium STE3]|nr:hypothetical protein PHSC3_001633 [Chlamydiales bacterium STE3]
MDPNTMNLIISLISGLIGGNIAGSAMSPEKNLGGLFNSVSGLIGGGIGGYILKAVGLVAATTVVTQAGVTPEPASLDLSMILANIGGGGAVGAILTALTTWAKDASEKQE